MSEVTVQLCPETGICSIIKGDGSKVDLMPDEVTGMRDASGRAEAVRQALAEVDSGFADGLDEEEIRQITAKLQ
jgi:hypothetical protein